MKNECVGSSKGKQNLSSCFPGFGLPARKGEILDDKTSAQHKFLGIKSTLDPGFGIRYDRFIRALMNHGRNDGFALLPFAGCNGYSPIRIMFSIS